MPTAARSRPTQSASPGSPAGFGLRPLPALSALAVALASAWVVTTAGDGEPGGAGSAGNPGLPAAVTLDADAPAPLVTRRGPSAPAPSAATPAPTGSVGSNPPGPAAPAAQPGATAALAAAAAPGVPDPAGPAGRDAQDTMYLTIVGDQTVVSWGPAGRRTARIDDLLARPRPSSPESDASPVDAGSDAPDGSATGNAQAAADDATDVDVGPEPQQCPRTLPPGSTQADADQLQALYSCRYLSGCRVGDGACTFFYQGRG
jgi:hypothetical protein